MLQPNPLIDFISEIHTCADMAECQQLYETAVSSVIEEESNKGLWLDLETLQALANVFDMKTRQLSGSEVIQELRMGPVEPLKPKELETLKWLAEGYTIKQISDEKVHRSVESTNLYIKSAKKKLNAVSRDQMVAKAILLNLLN